MAQSCPDSILNPDGAFELQTLDANALRRQLSEIEQQRAENNRMSSRSSSSSDDGPIYFAIDRVNLTNLNIRELSSLDILASDEQLYSDSDVDSGSWDLSYTHSSLSLNEETLVHEINRLDPSQEDAEDFSGESTRTFRRFRLDDGDVFFGVAKLEYTAVPKSVKFVNLKNCSRNNEQNRLEEGELFTKVDEKKTESPKVSFKFPEGKEPGASTSTSQNVLLSNPNDSDTIGKNVPASRTPYRSKNPSECSSITSASTSSGTSEFFKLTCLLIAGAIETALLITMIYFVPTDNITGALAMVGLCILFVFTFVCVLVIFKDGGDRCMGQLTFVV